MVSYVNFTVFKKNYLLQCIHIPNNKASPSVQEIKRAVLLPNSPKKRFDRLKCKARKKKNCQNAYQSWHTVTHTVKRTKITQVQPDEARMTAQAKARKAPITDDVAVPWASEKI